MSISELLTPHKAASLLGMDTRTLLKLIKSGEIPYVQVLTRKRISRDAITAFVNRQNGVKSHA